MCYTSQAAFSEGPVHAEAPFITGNTEGGGCMEFILSLLQDAATTIVTVGIAEFIKKIFTRWQGKTAPTRNRDGSDNLK
jgi:hypothetical protein